MRNVTARSNDSRESMAIVVLVERKCALGDVWFHPKIYDTVGTAFDPSRAQPQ